MKLHELIRYLQTAVMQDPTVGGLEVVVRGYEGGFDSIVKIEKRGVIPFAHEKSCYGQHGDPTSECDADDYDNCELDALELVGGEVKRGEAFDGGRQPRKDPAK